MNRNDTLIWHNAPCLHCDTLGEEHLGGKCLWGPQVYDGSWPVDSVVDRFVRRYTPMSAPLESRFDVRFKIDGSHMSMYSPLWRVMLKETHATTYALIFSTYASDWSNFLEGKASVF